MQADGQGAEAVPPPVARAPGIPDHELLDLIGRGAYGEVWLARNALGTSRAVKIVRRQSFPNPDHFEREFKGLLKFEPISRTHDGLVDILQIGRHDDEGYFYYVMELADDARGEREKGRKGERENRPSAPFPLFSSAEYEPKTLRSELHSHSCLPPADCVALGLKLAAALEHLHMHGLVHRDIKPSNIIFVGGEPKLADIGLVTAIDEAHSLVGTAGYIPPEGPGTPQADLYSLGKVLYEIAFGKDRQDFPQLPPDLSAHPDYAALLELNEVILKACETDPRRRYASATELREDLAHLQQGRSVKRRRTAERRWAFISKYGLATAAVTLLVVAVWLLAYHSHDAKVQPTATQSIAVLPFDNESPDPADDYLGRAIADELSGVLARIPELRVLGHDSATALKKTADRRAAAQELKLNSFLSGTVRKTGQQLRLSIRLTRGADDSLLWSEVYDRDLSELFGIQTEVASRLAAVLKLKVTPTVEASFARLPTKNLEAYRCYLEGNDCLYNRGGLAKALAAFQDARRLDTNFALAYAGLSHTYASANAARVFQLSPAETRSNSLALASHALKLDPNCAEAHLAFAQIKTRTFDWEDAEKGLSKALALDPTHTRAHQQYANLLMKLGRFDEGITAAQRAKALDPWSRRARMNLGWTYFHARRYGAAQEEFKDLVRMDPNDGLEWDGLGWCYMMVGQPDQATAAWAKAQQLWGWKPGRIAELAQAYKAGGMRGYHEKELEQMLKEANSGGFVDSYWIAVGYAETGQKDLAFQWLERAYEERFPWMGTVAVEPRLSSLHSDPRFAALLKKMGLKLPVWNK